MLIWCAVWQPCNSKISSNLHDGFNCVWFKSAPKLGKESIGILSPQTNQFTILIIVGHLDSTHVQKTITFNEFWFWGRISENFIGLIPGEICALFIGVNFCYSISVIYWLLLIRHVSPPPIRMPFSFPIQTYLEICWEICKKWYFWLIFQNIDVNQSYRGIFWEGSWFCIFSSSWLSPRAFVAFCAILTHYLEFIPRFTQKMKHSCNSKCDFIILSILFRFYNVTNWEFSEEIELNSIFWDGQEKTTKAVILSVGGAFPVTIHIWFWKNN